MNADSRHSSRPAVALLASTTPPLAPWLPPTLMLLSLVLAAVLLVPVRAQAQTSTTRVDLGGAVQSQSGVANRQEAEIGNARDGGRTDVTVGRTTQSQSGVANRQSLKIGNAGSGGSTQVHVGEVTQQQRGGFAGKQSVEIGNTEGGQTRVSVGKVIQDGNGSVRIGNR